MTSMYNKQDGLFSLVAHICIRGKDQKMSLKRHTNHLISSNHAYFMVSFSSSILFYNVNNSPWVSISCNDIFNSLNRK